MADIEQKTLFALDCGATNWRLYRLEYKNNADRALLFGEPQPSPLTSFNERKLPAVICLNPEGNALGSFGEVAQGQLETEQNRDQVREYFKPSIGVHLEENPLPHQKRYTHAQGMQYTRFLLEAVLNQIRQEKWRDQAFDDRLWFTFAYPIHWRYDYQGKIFQEFQQLVQSCFGDEFEQIRFVAEPEGAILCLQHRGMLTSGKRKGITVIIDVGGSTTDIVAGEVDHKSGALDFLGRYGEPFGGGLYDAELAKYIADELKIPASALADDPSALVSLRIAGQRLKESLSRQLVHASNSGQVHQRTVTLVLQDGTVFRRTISLDESGFRAVTQHLDEKFSQLVDQALEKMALHPEKISQIVLVGGGAQLFSIMSYLRERFGKDRVILADNPDETVVYGIGLEYQDSFEQIEPTIIFPAHAASDTPADTPPVRTKAWLLLVGDEQQRLKPGLTKLGRGETNHIQVDDLKASRLHAEISLSDEKLEIVDLGSTNGTFVNRNRLPAHQPCELKDEDLISIGKIRFVVKEGQENR